VLYSRTFRCSYLTLYFYIIVRSIFYETLPHDCLEYSWLCTCKIIFYSVKVYTCYWKIFKGINFSGTQCSSSSSSHHRQQQQQQHVLRKVPYTNLLGVSSDDSPVVVHAQQLLVQRLPVVNYGHILTRQPQTRVIGCITAPGLFDLTLESSLIAFPNPTERVRRRSRNQYSDWTTADKDYA